jgi:gamma-glutamylcyclotransferase (GGCT)/AIG2-like uncharacterized protein YtfP
MNNSVGKDAAYQLFAYGTLKQNEIAHEKIKEFIDDVIQVTLSGYEIGIRDSLPVIFEEPNSIVQGELLIPLAGNLKEFWKIVDEYEGSNLYTKKQISVCDNQNRTIDCFTFIGKREKARGYSKLDSQAWTSKFDPYLAYSFPLLIKEIRRIKKDSFPADMHDQYWQYMNRLQEKYLLLTVILEHIALLVVGTYDSTGPNARINELGTTEQWKLAYEIVKRDLGITKIEVKDAKKLKYKYGNETPEQAIKTYYQVRSNLSHQGKDGGYGDCELMYACLTDLSRILEEYLKLKIVGIETQWQRFQK